jgi:hypothetical protein
MRTLLEWRCGYCDSIQTSDSAKRWSMDYCQCGESFVDLEEHYQRNMGEVVVINTSVFGEIDTGDSQTTNTINEDGDYNKFLKLCETAGIIREGISEGTNEGINEGITQEYLEEFAEAHNKYHTRKAFLKKSSKYVLAYLLGVATMTLLYILFFSN